jgi:hypothetical protein
VRREPGDEPGGAEQAGEVPDTTDMDFLAQQEGGQWKQAYAPSNEGAFTGQNDVPLGATVKGHRGVTITTGFDLGKHNVYDLRRIGVGENLREKFEFYLGKKEQIALEKIKAEPIDITPRRQPKSTGRSSWTGWTD